MTEADLPRGWTYQTLTGAGVQASIVVPAAPGVARVLTDVKAMGYSYSSTGAVGPFGIDVSVFTASIGGGQLVLIYFGRPGQPINVLTPFSDSWAGKVAGAQGDSLTVKYGSGEQGNQFLLIAGYDI